MIQKETQPMRHPYPDAPSPETRRARWIRRAVVAIQTLIFIWALLSQVVGGNTDTDDSTQPARTDQAADILVMPQSDVAPLPDTLFQPEMYVPPPDMPVTGDASRMHALYIDALDDPPAASWEPYERWQNP
jgi:type IV secretory pathway VirB10-like protein